MESLSARKEAVAWTRENRLRIRSGTSMRSRREGEQTKGGEAESSGGRREKVS
jgi:hypothetical protein